jgi:hypothetical protein
MTLLILKGDVPYGYVPNVPDGKTRDEVTVLWLTYMGIALDEHKDYRAVWIAGADYKVMSRWYKECEMHADLEELKG